MTKQHRFDGFHIAFLAAAMTFSPGIVSAVPVDATLDYTCVFPIIEEQSMQVAITSDMPERLAPGEASGVFNIDAVATVSADAWNGLHFVGSKTLSGKVNAASVISAPGLTLPLVIPMQIPSKALPDSQEAFSVSASGQTPSLSFTTANTGEVDIVVGDLVMQLQPLDGNTNPTGLGFFESECSLDSGQTGLLHTIIVDEETSQDAVFPFIGQATINQHSDLPLSGTLVLAVEPGSTDIAGDMVFDSARLIVKVISFFNTLTLEADVAFHPQGEADGSISDDSLTLQQSTEVQLQNARLKMFGLPISSSGMGQCKSQSPVMLNLSTPGDGNFSLNGGGPLEGQFELPPFTDCGLLTSAINQLISGMDNHMNITLTREL